MPYVGDGSVDNPWTSPFADVPGVGVIDLRPPNGKNVAGRHLVWVPGGSTDPRFEKLVDRIEDRISVQRLSALENRLGISFSTRAPTMADTLAELFTTIAATKSSLCKPLSRDHSGRLSITLGSLKEVWFDQGPEPTHTASYTETWPTVGAFTSSQDQSWAALASGALDIGSGTPNFIEATTINAFQRFRSLTILDTDNHYHELTCDMLEHASGNSMHCKVRQAEADTDTAYHLLATRHTTAGSRQRHLQSVVAGSVTNLATSTTDVGASFVAKVSANGSTIQVYIGGVLIHSVTDTAITTNRAVGGMCRYRNATTDVKLYSHTFADIVSPAGGAYYQSYYRKMVIGALN